MLEPQSAPSLWPLAFLPSQGGTAGGKKVCLFFLPSSVTIFSLQLESLGLRQVTILTSNSEPGLHLPCHWASCALLLTHLTSVVGMGSELTELEVEAGCQ